MCPLLIATVQSNLPVVRLCVQCPEADLNLANSDGKTALILAIGKGEIDILKALLQGADVVERVFIDHKDVSA